MILRSYEVFHIPGLGFDGLVGYSPIAMAKNAIGMAIATEEYGAKFSQMVPIRVVCLNTQASLKILSGFVIAGMKCIRVVLMRIALRFWRKV